MEIKDEVLKSHPDWPLAMEVIETLKKKGFEAVLAGGCVRDALLVRKPSDLDVATSAQPSEVEEAFSKTVAVGKAFGVIRVLGKGAEIEVASFRFDGKYVDGRRPVAIEFASPLEDAKRRDFTINALFYDPVQKKVIDYVKGQQDIELGIIRCVGLPNLRFQEDHLRILRAIRFSAQLGFVIEPETWQAVRTLAPLVKSVSRERIRDEILKILKSKNPTFGFKKLHEAGLLRVLDPALNQIFDATPDLFQKFFLKKNENENETEAKAEKKIWAQFFAVFRELSLDAHFLKQQFNQYKLSKETQRFVYKALFYLGSFGSIKSWSLGKKLIVFSEEEFQWAIGLARGDSTQVSDWSWIDDLKLAYNAMGLGRGFPSPLLRGEDLPQTIPVVERKNVLELAFEQQLEQGWVHRKEALAWLCKKGK
jgi:poly(A) polymerase